ncbi:MAG: FAD-dependent oxidoreductase [Elusimicrobia bacterium]|nr:FAD-dependent oxidoreductase [Elusimicrobiota bacterium]
MPFHQDSFEAVVIGGGITGAGVARDCAMRGLKTLLLEKGAPGAQTTAASSHLIHGGLRYLLYDRLTTHATSWDSGNILRVAGALLKRLPFIWPVYRWHSHGIETVETLLEEYDRFQRMKGGRPHLRFSASDTLRVVPSLEPAGLVGSVAFDEWLVDPVALVEANLESARRHGATVRCGVEATGLVRSGGRVTGVETASGPIPARLVINAAGPWIDRVAAFAGASIGLSLRQGTHLVYGRRLMPAGLILEAPPEAYPPGAGRDQTRCVFVIPMGDRTLVGPTDVPCADDPGRLQSEPDEVRYILGTVRRYLAGLPRHHDRTTVGARPILEVSGDEKRLSRGFEVFDHQSRDGAAGLLTIGGGKMSDFRLMAEAVTDLACRKLGVDVPCRTHLETLGGQPVPSHPSFALPRRNFKEFLGRRPRLRELHALSYLGLAFARHLARRVAGGRRLARPEDWDAYYR